MRKSVLGVAVLALLLALSVSGLALAQETIQLAGWSSSDAENAALTAAVEAF